MVRVRSQRGFNHYLLSRTGCFLSLFSTQTFGIAILSLCAVRMFCMMSNQEIESFSEDTFFTVCSKDPNSVTRYPIKQFGEIPELPMILFLVLYLSIQGFKWGTAKSLHCSQPYTSSSNEMAYKDRTCLVMGLASLLNQVNLSYSEQVGLVLSRL